MAAVRQLYQLQALELEIESKEQALAQALSQLGESQAVAEAKSRLTKEQQHLEELQKEQHSAEWEIEDLETKLAVAKEALYSGRIKNPKELTGLQHEVESLKDKRNRLEEKALGIMEQVEMAQTNLANLKGELKEVEDKWRIEQQKRASEIEQLENILSELKNRRQTALTGIDSEAIDLYQQLRKQKGVAVARVERGICCGCRIALSTAELQRARGTRLLMCNYCGRILFLD